MRYKILTILIFYYGLFVLSVKGQENDKYVNPFIGTAPTTHPSKWDGHGRTYPGAVAPFGFIHLTPETRVASEKGYDYCDSEIYFFSFRGHYSGYPNGSSGQGQIMPVENGSDFLVKKYSRPFSHLNEEAVPGYYKVTFSDNNTTVETTASVRSGMFRFSYKNNLDGKIFVGGIGDIKLAENYIVKGSRRNVYIQFNIPWKEAQPNGDGYIFTFDVPAAKSVLLKLSSSSVSFKNARMNLDAEIPGWDFDALKNETQKQWNEKLSAVEITDHSTINKTKFYTALYHLMLMPWIISDVDGSYSGWDRKVYKSKGKNQYGAFSPWDTFRSLHPLLCILAPDVQEDIINSMLDVYQQRGELPNEPMTGFHSVPVIVDSYFKGCNHFDHQLAYKAMRHSLMESPWKYEDMPAYIVNGFVPATYPESVTRTVEYAYNDWALSRFAKELNQIEDDEILQKRALSYRNLFDPEQLFLVPRNGDDYIFSDTEFGYKEGDKWNYSFFVPQNIRDLINLMGGDETFTELLDSAIVSKHIIFDNEPNFHIPYLFNYSGKPSETQRLIAEMREELFPDEAGGLPGNDDLGSMSSWYVFNALGFLPVTPGILEYNIGTPMFEKVTIHLPNGNDCIIEANKVSAENRYIQSASLNGNSLENYWFSHADLEKGAKLVFEMGDQPSGWAANPQNDAFSITKKESDILVVSLSASKKEVVSNEAFCVRFQLKNSGASGVKIIRLLENGKELARKNMFVKENETVNDSVLCRLYIPGKSKLGISGSPKTVSVKVKDSGVAGFEYSALEMEPLLKPGVEQKISFSVKNTGGKQDSEEIEIVRNNKLVLSDKIRLEPGEEKQLNYSFAGGPKGANTVQVDALKGLYKVVANPKETLLTNLNFQHKSNSVLIDQSGFENNGILHGFNSENSEFNFNEKQFIEIENTAVFKTLTNEITMMVWIKPSGENLGQSSLLTQGDFNVIQMSGNRDIEFFAGGWGRGTCNVLLEEPLTNEWHHIAGVCEGLTLKLYLDGDLIASTEVNIQAELRNNANWNVGQNEEFPRQRIFYGHADAIKIFASALSEKQIKEIVSKSTER